MVSSATAGRFSLLIDMSGSVAISGPIELSTVAQRSTSKLSSLNHILQEAVLSRVGLLLHVLSCLLRPDRL